MAMFGLTAGAVWVYVQGERFNEGTLSRDLAFFSTAFAVTIALCLAVQMTLVPVATKSLTSIWVWVELAVCISIPFFFSGVIVSLALTRSPFPIGRVYGVDLLGAALGCLGVIAILNYTDGPSAILWVGAIGAAAAIFFARSTNDSKPDSRSGISSFFRFRKTIFANRSGRPSQRLNVCRLSAAGSQGAVREHLRIFREWNTAGRGVWKAKNAPEMRGPSMYPRWWDQRVMNIDGDAGSTMYRFTGDLQPLEFRFDVTNLAYFLQPRQRR
jgi:hypothetical protein